MTEEFLRNWLPVGISALSLVLASFALGWNIYRDVVLRGRVVVRFAVVNVVSPGVTQHGSYLNIKVTNHGPGPVVIHGIIGKLSPWPRSLLRRWQYFVLLNGHSNPYESTTPCPPRRRRRAESPFAV